MRVLCLLFEKSAKREEAEKNFARIAALAEACYKFTPSVAVRQGEALFLEISACRHLYKEENLLLRIQALLKRFDLKARIGASDSAAKALAFARFCTSQNSGYTSVGALPLQALYDFESPFESFIDANEDRDFDNDKQIASLIAVLHQLGLSTLKDFLELNPSLIASRFKALGLDLHRKVQGLNNVNVKDIWPLFVCPEKTEESFQLDYHENCQTLEPLLFVLRTVAQRIMARLAGRGERLNKFELIFELEKLSTVADPKRHWVFELPLSQGSVTGLMPVIEERLHRDLSRQPLASSVVHIKFRVLETSPGQYWQRNFFNKKEEEQEAWNSLVARLCEKLGKDHSFVASTVEDHKPENAWRRASHREKDDSSAPATASAAVGPANNLVGHDLPFPERPLRILKKPQLLMKIQNSLMPMAGGQANSQKRWEIADWEGPERLAGEWWGTEFQRDYFRVGTNQGEQLWIFRVPESDQIYLHGYFD